ncbi:hypothetical protein Tco_1367342 [Tanacetum coccineum]
MKHLFALLNSPSTKLESSLHYVNKLPLGGENRTQLCLHQFPTLTSDHARQLSYAGRTRKQPYWLDRPPAEYTDYLWIRRSSAEERFNEVVDTYQDLEELEDRGIILDNSTLTFAKRLKRCLKVDKLNLSKLEEFGKDGYELFGNRFTSKAEYDYNMDQMTIAMSDDMDWAIDYGLGLDSNEPLPLGRKYALFITKCHAAEYKIEWIEEDNGNLFRRTLVDYDADAMLGIHHWEKMKRLSYRGKRSATIVEKVYSDLKITFVDAVKVDVLFEYGFLESIIVTRADKKKYTFKESDFSRLCNILYFQVIYDTI